MLYVFHVDTGRMITFDMGVALENVQYLKEMIETHYHIPAASQVLLVSGGEMLSPQNRICSYLGGTDTNPIFMFSTNIIESKNPPQPWPSIEPDNDLKDQVERCLSLPANYNTVVKRAQLAQQIYELGREETRTCEKLVHEQHLQQQGWAAVVANMEDLTEEFKKRCSDFQNAFNEVLEKRIEYLECLSHFNEDLDKLSNIPILPALLQNAEKPFHAFDDVYENDSFQKGIEKVAEGGFPESSTRTTREGSAEETKSSSSSVKESEEKGEEGDDKVSVKAMTLLQWISAQENQISLRKMAAECLKSLEQFDEKEMTSLKTEVKNAIENAQKEDVKLIKGLEDRLSGLEKLMFDVKNIVKEQSELAQAFQQNQARANNLGDTSILPDLCVSHKNQLIVMRRNHKQLRDIRSRISRAKTELGHNLLQRLKYISYIENRMYEIDSKLLFIHRNCRRLQKHMGIIEQIHQAPSVYVTAVTEVVRRRTFSSAFLLWASDLASHLTTIYSEEVVRRQEFWSMFEGHFLCTLFPGIEDMPPSYATVAPSTFDASLPNLTRDDINELSALLPDFGLKIELPDLSAVIDFFSSRSGGKNEDKSTLVDGDRTNGSTISRNVAVGTSDLPKILDMHSHLKDYERGFESETDTEEFEKVGQSPIDRRRISTTGSLQAYTTLATSTQTSLAPVMTSLSKPEMCNISTSTEVVVTQTIETLTEENLGTTRCEVEKLKNLLRSLHAQSQAAIQVFREQIKDIRHDTESGKSDLDIQLKSLNDAWEMIKLEATNHQQELIKRTVDHELELNDLKKTLDTSNEMIVTLQNEKKSLEDDHKLAVKKYEVLMEEMQEKVKGLMEAADEYRAREVKVNEEKEKLTKEITEKLMREHKSELESLRSRYKLMTSIERSPSDTSLEKIERPDLLEMSGHEAVFQHTKDEFVAERGLAIKSTADRERSRWEHRSGLGQILLSGSPKSPSKAHDICKRIIEDKDNQLELMRQREEQLLKDINRHRETIQNLTEDDTNSVIAFKEKVDGLQKDKSRLEQELEMEKSKRLEMESSFAALKVVNPDSTAVSPDQMTRSGAKSKSSSSLGKGLITISTCSKGDLVIVVWNSIHEQYIIVQDENRYKVSKGTKFYRVKVEPVSSSPHPLDAARSSRRHETTGIQSGSVGRSTSTELPSSSSVSQTSTHLIDSFAQTECPILIEDVSEAKDMVDSGVDAQQKSIYKERNVSVTEEDEPVSLSDQRCCNISVSEEDEEAANVENASEIHMIVKF
uniref:RB1-inducible coiled-coil protein 1 n=1 Tax=Lutzomyia longipalpis TaxID=7200 RepID=A0A1B0C9Y8_LUTLO